jgi:hypothetical protein
MGIRDGHRLAILSIDLLARLFSLLEVEEELPQEIKNEQVRVRLAARAILRHGFWKSEGSLMVGLYSVE